MDVTDAVNKGSEKAKAPEAKKIKLDRSHLGLSSAKSGSVSNGVKKDKVTEKKERKAEKTENKSSLINPDGNMSDSDYDDVPLFSRAKQTNGSDQVNLPMKNADGESVKKIKKIKRENPSNISPKSEKIPKLNQEEPTKNPNSGTVKKLKLKSSKTDLGVKKTKTEPGIHNSEHKSDNLKSSKTSVVKKSSSNSSVEIKKEKQSMPSPAKAEKLTSAKSNTNLKNENSGNVKKDGSSKANVAKKSSSNSSLKLKINKKMKKEDALETGNGEEDDRGTKEGMKKVDKNKEETLKKVKKERSYSDSDEDDVPLASRTKIGSQKRQSVNQRKRKGSNDEEDEDDYQPAKKTKKKSDVGVKDGLDKKKQKTTKTSKETTKKGTETVKTEKKEKKAEEVWKWWEEEKHPEGIKWLTLEHKGPYFPPEYEPLPHDVNFYYDGVKIELSPKSEEVAGFYAKMLDHEYTSKKIFNDNFFQDWRKEMTDGERGTIKDLSKCNFKEINAYYVQKNEERKNMTKEEKQVIKAKNEEILQEYGYCMMDNHRERVGNFKIEPPGLFRGRGDHPKQGKLKKRLQAKDIIINIGKDAKVPDPPNGQRWKAVQHDNKVTWLACWIENIQGSYKYVMLNPTSRIKGEKDWQKYETARKLKGLIGQIRQGYRNDWKSKEMRIRQRGVALYFIDKLALRAGHEKDEDTADTVGCCSLRYEHIKLHKQLEDKEYVVEFDFLGKDSIHYHNFVPVEKKVFKNLELFQQGKTDGDDLFDRLTTTSLNKHLSDLMEGLSAKVFRTYNASMTLQEQLDKLELEDNVAARVLGYNRANRAVAILCNHQRSVPKTFEQSMSNLQQKIDDKKKAIKDGNVELKDLKREAKGSDSVTLAKKIEKKKVAIERLKEQLFKLEVSQTDKNENKEIALGTSKLNYLDPRISIAWCLKNDVPIEKIYNKTQRQKFAWAIDMTEKDFVF